MLKMSKKITIYVDGACRGNPGLGGWGIFIQHGTAEECYYGGALETTNNRMELTASIQALSHTANDASIDIWTDSNYVKRGITEWIVGWKNNGWKNSKKQDVLNADLWKVLDELCQNRDITWHWVKGHAGHFGNEMADALANRGADEVQQSPQNEHQIFQIEAVNSPELVKNMPLLIENTANSTQQPSTTSNSSDWLLNDLLGFNDEVEIDEDSLEMIDSLSQKIEQNNIIQPPDISITTFNESLSEEETKKKRKKKKVRPPMEINQIQQYIITTPATKLLNGTRQLILDTETTGFHYHSGDRVIEVGAIEMINRKLTGSSIHIYIQPEKEVGESVNVHGITDEFLQDKPIFGEVAEILFDYLKNSEIIAHNASFDMNFLDMEFEKVGLGKLSDVCPVIDTLVMAKAKHPGQRNSLDALVRRYAIPERDRTFHGALLDAEILADVYLAMTGGQVSLDISDDTVVFGSDGAVIEYSKVNSERLPIILPSDEEMQQHEQWYLKFYEKNNDIAFFHALVDTALAEEIAKRNIKEIKELVIMQVEEQKKQDQINEADAFNEKVSTILDQQEKMLLI